MTASIRSSLAVLALLLAPAAGRAQTTPAAEPAAPTTAPSQAEAKPTPPPEAPRPPPPPSVTSKFNVSFYGFVILDVIHDSTRSFDIGMGSGAIARAGTLAGDNGRTIVTARESRFGFRINAPEYQGMKLTGQLEADFDARESNASEANLYTVGFLRLRQANIKLETKVLDVLFGQTAYVFGWQPFFYPATVSNFALPGQPFSRNVQLRLGKFIKGDALSAEVAVAALRPPQRDAEIPEFQGGARFMFNRWKGIHTLGTGGTAPYPLSIGVSGAYRKFKVSFSDEGLEQHEADGQALAVDALVPVLPAREGSKGNSLTLTGTFVTGKGYGDLIGGPGGGNASAALPAGPPAVTSTAPGGNLVTFDAARELTAVEWTGFVVGGDYYLPPNGRVFVSAVYAQVQSDNVGDNVQAGNLGAVYDRMTHYEGNVFFDVTPALRLGLNYQRREQEFLDGETAKNDRYQFNALYFF
ncbi:MAG TPA: hypothetical protein VEB43_02185 [Anaeromyxobacter sp.]|nr:hypothetical protein [Anaeromyxobacter sp.]